MLSKEQNEIITRTGPGTPGGELFRRYWLPVGLSTEVTAGGKPNQVKVLSEDLVLFRDTKGRPGLLGLHCSHRLTSLAYGRVEDGGIRCPFHGWLYDIEGRCLEQPAEPEPFTGKIQHPAYPCQELEGLIFAYMGPIDKMPLLPRYEFLIREDGTRKVDFYFINSNYLQNLEGAVDKVHIAFLHMNNWSKMKHEIVSKGPRKIEFKEDDYGIWERAAPYVSLSSSQSERSSGSYDAFFMPAGYYRTQRSQRGILRFLSWYVPMDDTHTKRFQVGFMPLGKDGKCYEWPRERSEDFVQPGPENDYFRGYGKFDTISGIPADAPGTAIKGFLAQDSMVNESQGPIEDRTQEHLGAHDKVLAAMRVIYQIAINDVRNGKDPKHIIRDPAKQFVHFRGPEDESVE